MYTYPRISCLLRQLLQQQTWKRNVIKYIENARRVFSFDEVAHDLVVKVLDRSPLDTLMVVLFLFGLESQLDEELLQLFIDIIDTELLESIFLYVVNFEKLNWTAALANTPVQLQVNNYTKSTLQYISSY